MKKLLVFAFGFCLLACVAGTVGAREASRNQVFLMEDTPGKSDDFPLRGWFGPAPAGTTWIGWVPGAYDPVTNPHSIGAPGFWDFDDRGTRPCPVQDGLP